MKSTRYSRQILSKLEFSGQIFEKYSQVRFLEIELFHADGRTDRHDEASSRFSQFCEKA
jgi:hypothetical protein